MPLKTQILSLAKRLKQATDQEHWPDADKLLAEINHALRQPEASGFDKATLENVLAAVQTALQDTQRRRDEIGVLVRGLGGTTDKPADPGA